MSQSITASIVAALSSFNEFIEQIKSPESQRVEGLSLRGWEDELGRLRIWAANIGAHQTNQSSLDFRLRDASHVREQIIKLLGSLNRRLDDAKAVLNEEAESDKESLSDHDSEEETLNLKPEIQQMQESVATIVSCLFRMSMLVRKPAQHDLRVSAKPEEVAVFQPYDYGHVRDKYPNASQILVSRLGSAITRRRMHLKYRERHAAKLKQGIATVTESREATNEETATLLSETVATKAQNLNIDFDGKGSISGESQTSYASTLMSGSNITIPPPPKESYGGKPFECPICYHIIKIRSTRSWNKHVFVDLQPYSCLDVDCTTPQNFYATRHDWLRHMEIAHPTFEGSDTAQGQGAVCPLCLATFSDRTARLRHSARHLQDLALFVLPSGLHEIEDDSVSETSVRARSRDAEELGSERRHPVFLDPFSDDESETEPNDEADSNSTTSIDKNSSLSKALERVNHAVLLDNAQNFDETMNAYTDAVALLQEVIQRSSDEEN